MSKSVKELVKSYYDEFNQAARSGQLNYENFHFSNHIKIVGPESFEGRAVVEPMYQTLTKIIKRLEVKALYFDDTSACVILEAVTDTAAGSVPTVERFITKDGQITELHVYFDTARWSKVN